MFMKKPQMILFDYGQTLIDEQRFDGIRGTRAVLESCVRNPNRTTAEEIQKLANELNRDIGRYEPLPGRFNHLEVHNHSFQNYLYEYFGLSILVSHLQLETIFWDAAAPGQPTVHIHELIGYLSKNQIRFGIISNISYSGQALRNRINRYFPQVDFEFILATSEYVFRKPHQRIFELALRKANLAPDEVWYCGDNLVCDIAGAAGAGIMPVWYTGATEKVQAEPAPAGIRIDDWLQLMAILENR